MKNARRKHRTQFIGNIRKDILLSLNTGDIETGMQCTLADPGVHMYRMCVLHAVSLQYERTPFPKPFPQHVFRVEQLYVSSTENLRHMMLHSTPSMNAPYASISFQIPDNICLDTKM